MCAVSRPCLWTLPSCRRTLYIDDLSKDEVQLQAAFQLISDAAQRGDNIGVDEITPEMFDLLLQYIDVAVTLSDPDEQSNRPGRLLGLLVVCQSRFSRIAHATACQLFVITAEDLSGRQTWRELASLGVGLAAELNGRYVDCFVEVFVPCLERVLAMRDDEFVITACIPEAGILKGHHGHTDSYIMYKQLDTHNPLPPQVPAKDDDEDYENLSFTLCELPDYLPCRCNIDNGQTQIIIRPLRRDEVGDFYALVKNAAAAGKGFGLGEIPNLGYFIRWYVDGFHNLVYELEAPEAKGRTLEADDGQMKRVIIGYNNFGPSIYSRSRTRPALFDGNIIFSPEFRDRGWVLAISHFYMGLLVDCGIRCFFQSTFVLNAPGNRSLRRAGANVCGIVPRNGYFRGFGFVDDVLYYKPLNESYSLKARNRTVQSKI